MSLGSSAELTGWTFSVMCSYEKAVYLFMLRISTWMVASTASEEKYETVSGFSVFKSAFECFDILVNFFRIF